MITTIRLIDVIFIDYNPAHSDCCFLRRVLIFLLTYLLTTTA